MEAPAEPDHRQQRQQAGGQRLAQPRRILDHRPGERELRLAVGVEHAPVGAGAALAQRFLPRLVEGLHHVVVDVVLARPAEPAAQEDGLVGHRRIGVQEAVAVGRPADLADHDGLVRVQAVQRVVARDHVIERIVQRYAFPVGQQVHGDEVHVLDQLRVLLPDVPRLGGRHRLADLRAGAVQVGHQLGRLDVVAQQHLVADQHAGDGLRVAPRLRRHRVDLLVVVQQASVDPRAGHHVQALGRGQADHLRVLDRVVGADVPGVARQQLEVGADLPVAGVVLVERPLVALVRAVGEAVDRQHHVVRTVGQVAPPPQPHVEHRQQQGQQHRDDQGLPASGGAGLGGQRTVLGAKVHAHAVARG